MSVVVGDLLQRNINVVQHVLGALIFVAAIVIFGLSISLAINTVVTEQDLLLGTVVADSDRAKIKAITGLSLTIAAVSALSAVLRYRFEK